MEENQDNLEAVIDLLEALITEILSDPEIRAEMLLMQQRDVELN